jgi:hypothetical protein
MNDHLIWTTRAQRRKKIIEMHLEVVTGDDEVVLLKVKIKRSLMTSIMMRRMMRKLCKWRMLV